MSSRALKALILAAYAAFIFVAYSPALYLAYQEKADREKAQTPAVKKIDTTAKVYKQYVETSFHNYLVIIQDNQVTPNGVVHLHNCKCKTLKK